MKSNIATLVTALTMACTPAIQRQEPSLPTVPPITVVQETPTGYVARACSSDWVNGEIRAQDDGLRAIQTYITNTQGFTPTLFGATYSQPTVIDRQQCVTTTVSNEGVWNYQTKLKE